MLGVNGVFGEPLDLLEAGRISEKSRSIRSKKESWSIAACEVGEEAAMAVACSVRKV